MQNIRFHQSSQCFIWWGICFLSQSAVGHEYKADLSKHASQTDAAKGFGGKYGVQKERQDKSAVGYEHKEKLQQHASQKGEEHKFHFTHYGNITSSMQILDVLCHKFVLSCVVSFCRLQFRIWWKIWCAKRQNRQGWY